MVCSRKGIPLGESYQWKHGKGEAGDALVMHRWGLDYEKL